jgi:photosystem II stability/assembly factor-like uncharacterized protein
MRSWRHLSLSLFSLLIFATLGFAQQETVQQDDNTDTAVQRERAEARAQALAGRQQGSDGADGDMGEIQDDATARIDWQIHSAGVHTPESKKKLLHQRGAGRHGGHGKRGMRGGPDAATLDSTTDLGNMTFSASGVDLQQVGSSSTDPTWVPIGPADAEYEQNGGFAGRVRDSGRARKILPHPTDANTLYFLTSGGGLWVSNNFLSDPPTWRPLTDNLPTTGGGSVAFGRTPNVLYLGLGDPFDVIQVGGAMVKSVDGGQTWTNFVELGAAQSVRDVQVDTSGPNDIVLVTTDIGLFRSTDGGITYNQILGAPGELFRNKSMWHMVRSSAGFLVEGQSCPFIPAIACGTAGAIYISTDAGATWAPIPNTNNGFTGAGRATLAVAVPGDSIVYAIAGTVSENAQLDLFRSTDGGLNWTPLNITSKTPTNPNNNQCLVPNQSPCSSGVFNMNLLHAQAFYNQLILVDPRDVNRNIVYLGGDLSSAKTTDGGNSWTLISDWLYGGRGPSYAHADFHTATFANLNGTATLLFGNDGGLFVSTDNGTTFSSNKNKGLETFLFYTITGNPNFPNALIAGAQDNGTRVRKDKSRTFNQSLGGDGLGVGWGQASRGLSIGTAAGSGSYRLNFLGKIPDRIEDYVSVTYYPSSGPTSEALFGVPVEMAPPATDPTGTAFYLFSTRRALRVDNFLTTTLLGIMGQNGLPASGRTFRGDPHNMAVSPDLNHIAINANAGNIEITSNALNAGTANPVTWTERSLTTLVPGWPASNSSVTWADNQTLFVTSESPLPNAPRIAKSTNGGTTFARADSGIPDGRITRIIVDSRDASHNTLYAAGDLGVFKSVDGANSWQPYGNGLPNVRVSDIYMPPDGSALIAGTYGRGLWELPSLTYASSTLTDDGTSCDKDGVLDAGETGNLNITLHNDGNGTFNSITATITSNNPNVTFPNGNTISFPTAGPGADSTSSIAVKMDSGATGIQTVTFTIGFTDSSLNLPSAVTAQAPFRINYDEVPNGSANDNFEAASSPWTVTGTPTSPPNIYQWERREIGPTEHRWADSNSNAIADQALISPVMHIGSDPFTFSFQHRHAFEFTNGPPAAFFDGMVIEISTNNGASWADIGQFATPAYNHTIAGGGGNPLSGRPAYTALNASYPNFNAVSVNVGTQFAGQDVRIRFRIGTDFAGFFSGIEIRNFTTTGLTNTPFTAVIPHRGVCPTTTSLSSSENPSSYGHTVTFLASISGGVSTATGTVTFKDSGSSIGTGAVNNSGQANFSISSLSAGSHQITAEYSGDATHASSASDSFTQVVNPAPLTITADNKSRLLDSPNPPLTATYSGFVLGQGPGVLTGTLSCTTTALTNSPPGDYPITCSGQSSTNYAITYVAGTLSVLFASTGSCLGEPGHTILPPIAANGTSVFNGGRTVPAKFRVCDANGVSIGTPGTVRSFNIVEVIAGTNSNVTLTVDSTTPDTAFRWDPTAQQWIFNISTRSLAPGATYVFRIGLSDGSDITFQFGLR